jgi:excisionase family DNA binding protein
MPESTPPPFALPLPAELVEAIAERAAALVLEQLRENTGDHSPVWLTVADAATYLGLTQHAVRHLLDRRAIRRHQHVRGGRILVKRSDLDRYLDEECR